MLRLERLEQTLRHHRLRQLLHPGYLRPLERQLLRHRPQRQRPIGFRRNKAVQYAPVLHVHDRHAEIHGDCSAGIGDIFHQVVEIVPARPGEVWPDFPAFAVKCMTGRAGQIEHHAALAQIPLREAGGGELGLPFGDESLALAFDFAPFAPHLR